MLNYIKNIFKRASEVDKVFETSNLRTLTKGMYGLVYSKTLEWKSLTQKDKPPNTICGEYSQLLGSTLQLLTLSVRKFFNICLGLAQFTERNLISKRTLECYDYTPRANLSSPLFFKMLCSLYDISPCYSIELNGRSNKNCGEKILVEYMKIDNSIYGMSKQILDRKITKRETYQFRNNTNTNRIKRTIFEASVFGGGQKEDLSGVISALEEDRKNLEQLNGNQQQISTALSTLAAALKNADNNAQDAAINELSLKQTLGQLISQSSKQQRDFQDLTSQILASTDSLTTSLVSIVKSTAESQLGSKTCYTDAEKVICYLSNIHIHIDKKGIMTLSGIAQNLEPKLTNVLKCVPTKEGLFLFNDQFVIGKEENSKYLLYSNNQVRNKEEDSTYFLKDFAQNLVKIPPCFYHPFDDKVLVSCETDIALKKADNTYLSLGAFEATLIFNGDFPLLIKGEVVDRENIVSLHRKQNIFTTIRKLNVPSADFIPDLLRHRNSNFEWKGLTFDKIFFHDIKLQTGVYSAAGSVLLIILGLSTCGCCICYRLRRAKQDKKELEMSMFSQSTTNPRYSMIKQRN